MSAGLQALRVALIDDEPLARLGLRARLADHPGFECVAEFGDGASAREGLPAARPDLLIVDVQMPGLSGLDLLALWPATERPLAILHTAHAQHALRAFELQVVDYLLKPLDEERLAEALGRARAAWRARALGLSGAPAAKRQRFELRVGRQLHFVDDEAVAWIEAAGDYAELHCLDGRLLLLRESLNRLAERLDPQRFLRVHRSAIVRLDQVAALRPMSNRDALLQLRDGSLLRASRNHVPQLMAHLRDTGSATPPHG
jgi:two-component system LytT family response regulator